MNYVGTTINNSPTIVLTVGDGLKAAQGIAVAFDENDAASDPARGSVSGRPPIISPLMSLGR